MWSGTYCDAAPRDRKRAVHRPMARAMQPIVTIRKRRLNWNLGVRRMSRNMVPRSMMVTASTPAVNNVSAVVPDTMRLGVPQLDRDVLGLEIGFQSFVCQFATEAAFFHTAERALGGGRDGVVDADDSRLQPLRHP